MKTPQYSRTQLEIEAIEKDGDMEAIVTKKSIVTANEDVVVFHGLGRIPSRAYVIWCIGNFITCQISLDANGQPQADNEKSVLKFSATGQAVVKIA